jgi:hypothetical protein
MGQRHRVPPTSSCAANVIVCQRTLACRYIDNQERFVRGSAGGSGVGQDEQQAGCAERPGLGRHPPERRSSRRSAFRLYRQQSHPRRTYMSHVTYVAGLTVSVRFDQFSRRQHPLSCANPGNWASTVVPRDNLANGRRINAIALLTQWDQPLKPGPQRPASPPGAGGYRP